MPLLGQGMLITFTEVAPEHEAAARSRSRCTTRTRVRSVSTPVSGSRAGSLPPSSWRSRSEPGTLRDSPRAAYGCDRARLAGSARVNGPDPRDFNAGANREMPTPTFDELKHWAENYPKLWNAGDKQAWIDNWRAVGPGHFRMLDPVGTPEKEGFEHCCATDFEHGHNKAATLALESYERNIGGSICCK